MNSVSACAVEQHIRTIQMRKLCTTYLFSRLCTNEHEECGTPPHLHVEKELKGWDFATVLNGLECFLSLS